MAQAFSASCSTDYGSLLHGYALDAGLAAGEVEDDNVVALVSVEGDGAAATGFRIIRVRAYDDYFLPASCSGGFSIGAYR